MTPHDRQHQRNLQALAARIRNTFDTATAASIAAVAAIDFDPQHPFSFDDHPHAKPTYAKAEQQLHATILHHITTAASIAWMLSQRKNNTLVRQVFSQRKATIPTRYLNNEEMDIRAFAAQRVAGLNLSQRVWNIAHQFRTEIEDSIDLALRDGIAQGRTAAQISREVRKYLNDPNARFRRIRDQHGILRLSQRAKAYHPGRGVYRSAYKNALRMTLTETNRTYRRADHDRWQTLDFVVGIHVQLSHLHTLHGHTFHDICDELAGRYPKDFLFLGWHPLCRCIATPILKTPQEMQADDERTLQGQAPASQSVNSVKDAPQLTHWQAANAQRIQAAQQRGTLPYFIKDNPRYFRMDEKKKSPLDIAKERHTKRTKAQEEEIKKRWEERKIKIERQTIRNEAKQLTFQHPQLLKGITISMKGVKEWLNQPHCHYTEKNRALLHIKEIIANAKYIGKMEDKHNPAIEVHLLETKEIAETASWIILRHFPSDAVLRLHSVTDNDTMANIIKNKRT